MIHNLWTRQKVLKVTEGVKLKLKIQWVPGKSVHDLFGFSMTLKSFCLFQCIWLPFWITYPWCIANWSHWNQCIWSWEPRKHNFLFLKKSLIFYCVLWGPVTINDKHCFQWLQLAIHHGYVTLDGSHMHWNKQKDF